MGTARMTHTVPKQKSYTPKPFKALVHFVTDGWCHELTGTEQQDWELRSRLFTDHHHQVPPEG